MRREVKKAGGRTFYVLHFGEGAVVYDRLLPGADIASVNLHTLTQLTPGQSLSTAGCEFLGGKVPCWFDGTSLAQAQDDEEGIWRMLERWVP